MTSPAIVIRPERPADHAAVRDLVRTAFETAAVSGGHEQDFVETLRSPETYVPALALVAEDGGTLVGHVMLTRTAIETATGPREVLLLAPLSVALANRRCGLGARLVETAFAAARALGFDAVVLVGDPAYYGRFGFRAAADFGIADGNGIPAVYVQACELTPGALAAASGTITFATE